MLWSSIAPGAALLRRHDIECATWMTTDFPEAAVDDRPLVGFAAIGEQSVCVVRSSAVTDSRKLTFSTGRQESSPLVQRFRGIRPQARERRSRSTAWDLVARWYGVSPSLNQKRDLTLVELPPSPFCEGIEVQFANRHAHKPQHANFER